MITKNLCVAPEIELVQGANYVVEKDGVLMRAPVTIQTPTVTEYPVEKLLVYPAEPAKISGIKDLNAAAEIFREFDMVVLWDDTINPSSSDYDETLELCRRYKTDRPDGKLAGRISVRMDKSSGNLTMEQIKEYVDWWHAAGADGIYMDRSGYKSKVSRARQNEAFSYAKAKGMFVIAKGNGDKVSSFFSAKMDANYNPDGLPCILGETDYLMMEDLFFRLEWVDNAWKLRAATSWRVKEASDYFTDVKSEYGMTYAQRFKTRLLTENQFPLGAGEVERRQLRTIAYIGAMIFHIPYLAIQPEERGYLPWTQPVFELEREDSRNQEIETLERSITNADGTVQIFPYQWSRRIGDTVYSVTYDVPDPDVQDWTVGERFAAVGGRCLDDLWMTPLETAAFSSDTARQSQKTEALVKELAGASDAYQNDYTQRHIDERKAEILSLQRKGHCITFAIATDLHVEEANAGRYNQIRDFLMLADQIPLDYVCGCGDFLTDCEEWDHVRERRLAKAKTILDQLCCPWFSTRGNHDYNGNGLIFKDDPERYFVSSSDWYRAIGRTFAVHPDMEIVTDQVSPKGGYFYVDDYANKHRMIFTNSCETHEADNGGPYIGTSDWPECSINGIWSIHQAEWIVQRAMDMTGKTDWVVSFFSHILPYCDKNLPKPQEFHGYGKDNAALRTIVKAFQDGTAVTNLTWDTLDTDQHIWRGIRITKDFSAQGPIRVTGWFSGHIHDDCYQKVDGLNLFVSTCVKGDRRTTWSTDPDPSRLPPDRNQSNLAMSVNVVIINTDTRTVNVVKVGSKRDHAVKTSSDYEFTY